MEGKVEVGLLGKQLIHQLWKRRITNMLWWTANYGSWAAAKALGKTFLR